MFSIFPDETINRNQVNLEDYLFNLTPVEKAGEIYFKREDYFAPLGYGGVNGSKLRQLIWLVWNYVTHEPATGVVSGAVSGSPQHVMAAIVSKHYGLPYYGVVGGKSSDGKPALKLAEKYGASIVWSSIGYAKSLEVHARQYAEAAGSFGDNHFFLETNIVVNNKVNPVERVRNFHSIGGNQVKNIPENIETLIIPCGSATSTISILYGLHLHGSKNLKRIVLMGIGNVGSKDIDFIFRRLEFMGAKVNPDIEFLHYNLNGTGFCKYETLMPFRYGGIHFHPRYEGKCIKYLFEKKPEHFNDTTMFWIVGSEAKF